jgi:hypothetical protein
MILDTQKTRQFLLTGIDLFAKKLNIIFQEPQRFLSIYFSD